MTLAVERGLFYKQESTIHHSYRNCLQHTATQSNSRICIIKSSNSQDIQSVRTSSLTQLKTEWMQPRFTRWIRFACPLNNNISSSNSTVFQPRSSQTLSVYFLFSGKLIKTLIFVLSSAFLTSACYKDKETDWPTCFHSKCVNCYLTICDWQGHLHTSKLTKRSSFYIIQNVQSSNWSRVYKTDTCKFNT